MTLIFSLICYSACLFLLLSERKDIVWGKWVFKGLASTSFLMIALTLADVTSPFSNWMIVGFLFCLVGDILLIKSSNKHLFLLGIISFALGHLGFIIAFILSGDIGLVFYATLLLAIILIIFLSSVFISRNTAVQVGTIAAGIGIIAMMIAVITFIREKP